MDIHRKTWNQSQQMLKKALSSPETHPEWQQLFLQQHAQVHAAAISPGTPWSFEDEILADLDDDHLKRIPAGGEHSIAWVLFHLARIEDVTMNMLVADTEQLVQRDNWLEKMNISISDTANAFTTLQVIQLSQAIDMTSLYLYRQAVGRNTRQIVSKLSPDDLKRMVDPRHIDKVKSCGAVIAAADEILDYWSRRTLAGLLLMPPTRHCFIHLNEALHIRQSLNI